MEKRKESKRPRRTFTEEFKAGAVRLVLEEGRPLARVARELDLTETSLRSWIRQVRIDAGKGVPGAITSSEREELSRLRHENRILKSSHPQSPHSAGWGVRQLANHPHSYDLNATKIDGHRLRRQISPYPHPGRCLPGAREHGEKLNLA